MTSKSIDNLLTGLDNVCNDESVPSWARLTANSNKEILKSLTQFNALRVKIIELESLVMVCQGISLKLSEDNDNIRDELNDLKAKIDDNEQRNRNNCLIIKNGR